MNILDKIFNSKYKIITCKKLCSCLFFFSQKIAYCSNGNPNNLRKVTAIYDKFTGNLDINDLYNKIKNDRKNLIKGILPQNCVNCPELKTEKEISLKPQIDYIQFSDYSMCNSKCVYCNSWKNTKTDNNGKLTLINGKEDSYEIMPIIKQLIKKGLLTKDTTIDFAGGEPTAYRQFEEALSFLLKFGIKKVYIFSNVINYSQAIADGLKDGIITLTVSVDAGTKEMHRQVKGVKSYDSVWENLKKYSAVKARNNQLVSKYVIVPYLNDIEQEVDIWLQKSVQAGITEFILNADDRILEKELEEDVIKRTNKISIYFEGKAKEYNLNYDLYANIRFINDKVQKK